MAFLLLCGWACQKHDLKNDLFSNDPGTRFLALGKLSELSPEKKKILIPFFLESLNSNDPHVVDRAQDALKTAGETAVPDLNRALSDPNPYIRLSAAEVVAQMGVDVPGVVQALAKALEDPHPLIREEAGLALGRSEETIGLLILALQEKNKDVSQSAAKVLKLLNSPAAREALRKYRKTS